MSKTIEKIDTDSVNSNNEDNISLDNTLNITEEKIQKELNLQSEVAKEILELNEEEKIKRIITNPSAPALRPTDVEAGEGLNKIRKTVRQLFILYLSNQFVARAVNVRADTLVSKGYKIIGNDEKGIKACTELIENSGGLNLFWQLSVNTDIAGDGFLEPIYNLKGTKIVRLKHVHPLTLNFKSDKKTGRILIGKDKQPVGYVQHYINEKGVEVERPIPKDRIRHFKFNTLGDEFTGLSVIQPGYDTIVRLMNMEYSAAEAAIKTANPMWVGKCNTKSPHQIAQWGLILGKINGQDQLFIPEGMELEMKSPGKQNFNEYAEYFLNAVVACFGVPKGVLLGGGSGSTQSNRAQDIVLTRHFYNLIRSNQRYMQDFFNEIFKEYAKANGFEEPKLMFEDVAEDANLMAESSIKLFEVGIIDREEARMMIGLEPTSRGMNLKQRDTDKEIRKADMEAWHPESPGSPAGSQKGEKKQIKNSPYTTKDNKSNY